MDYNILIGGSAGQGMDTLAAILERVLKRKGFEIFTIRDYMSRVRGGHNFIQVRFGNEKLWSHRDCLDLIIALNDETIVNHIGRLDAKGYIICDDGLDYIEERVIKLPLKNTAKSMGNTRVSGILALAAMFKLYGLDLSYVTEVIENVFDKPQVAIQNLKAFNEGYNLVESVYEVTSLQKDGNILINGNEAIALGALAAGCMFYSAYPMTPSTSIMNYLAAKMEKAEIVVEQAEDEIAAINMAIGASYAGVRAMTGTSGGGFALMVEALGLAGMLEVPLVVAEIQRPGPTTGLPTRTEQSDLKFVISASQGEFPRMVIALRTPEDAFYQTIRAFNIADKYQIPVILLGDQYLADYTTTVRSFDFDKVEINRYISNDKYKGDIEYRRYEITESGISPRIIPGKVPGKTVLVDSDEHDEYGHITESAEVKVQMTDKRMRKIEALKEELLEPEFIGTEDFDVLLLAWGSLYGPVKEAVGLLNSEGSVKYAALVFGDIWPLPVKSLCQKAPKAKTIINIEQNATGQLGAVIMEVTGIRCTASILKYDGRPISSQDICEKIQGGE
ncbi:MAG: 2-oxoacid:acceptor oxidoreductase subunit alpha [Clostridia bacterium]|nr:2-oxoacid:acceptor oxidoreductase subunit alpha [Clostridia bacterium]